jgi:hypothetical protein
MTPFGFCWCTLFPFPLQGLARLEELVRKVMDIVDNRVEANLQVIQHTLLVELPADRCVLRTAAACITI